VKFEGGSLAVGKIVSLAVGTIVSAAVGGIVAATNEEFRTSRATETVVGS
jgi:hypothetical protein